MDEKEKPVIGLVLTGGGARAAYQAGVLRAVAEIVPCDTVPFQVIVGASAGALNGVAIASGAADYDNATKNLWNIWHKLRFEDVFRSDISSLFNIGLRLLFDTTFGGRAGRPSSNYLLNNAPLRQLLEREIDFDSLRENVDKGLLRSLGISATNYKSGTNITFYEADNKIEDWTRNQRISKKTRLGVEHIMASAAIPIFFPPVLLDNSYYGDGNIRLASPLSPAIHLGAEKLFAIGIRNKRTTNYLHQVNRLRIENVYIADIVGLLLNAIFMDSLQSDIERAERINRTIDTMVEERRKLHPDKLRNVPLLTVNPSRDLGAMAADQYSSFPMLLRHLLKGIGATGESGGELLSYIAFNSGYTSPLLELGYNDALAMKGEIEQFMGR